MTTIDILFIITISSVIFALIYCFIAGQRLDHEKLRHQLKIEELQETIESCKRSKSSIQEIASKAILGEACLLMALKERMNENIAVGYANATQWLKKRSELHNELDKEFDIQGHENLEEVYDSVLRIAQMIYSGELNIKSKK